MKLKPGVVTTEFWGTIALQAVTLAMFIADQIDAEWAVVVGSTLQAVYTLVRGWTKAKAIEATVTKQ